MTTIAYKDGILAGDTLSTCNGLRDDYGTKIWRVGRVLVGAAGSRGECLRFREWVAGGLVGSPPLTETNGIVVSPASVVCWSEKGCWPVSAPFYAIGTGYELALGAMAHGASADEAVRIAAQFDTRTGGEVTALSLHASDCAVHSEPAYPAGPCDCVGR